MDTLATAVEGLFPVLVGYLERRMRASLLVAQQSIYGTSPSRWEAVGFWLVFLSLPWCRSFSFFLCWQGTI